MIYLYDLFRTNLHLSPSHIWTSFVDEDSPGGEVYGFRADQGFLSGMGFLMAWRFCRPVGRWSGSQPRVLDSIEETRFRNPVWSRRSTYRRARVKAVCVGGELAVGTQFGANAKSREVAIWTGEVPEVSKEVEVLTSGLSLDHLLSEAAGTADVPIRLIRWVHL